LIYADLEASYQNFVYSMTKITKKNDITKTLSDYSLNSYTHVYHVSVYKLID